MTNLALSERKLMHSWAMSVKVSFISALIISLTSLKLPFNGDEFLSRGLQTIILGLIGALIVRLFTIFILDRWLPTRRAETKFLDRWRERRRHKKFNR